MTILDRYVLRGLLINYLIALAVMMSLYTVLDLFFNIDEFTESHGGIETVITNIASYYLPHACLYFAQLSGVIGLFACMATLARMRRMNELTAVLASGVSLYRVAVPVAVFGLVTSALWYVDTEWVIPSVGNRLARTHEDATGKQSRGVWFVKDIDGALLSALEFVPATGVLNGLLVLHRDAGGAPTYITEAERASWKPAEGHPNGGWWELIRGRTRKRSDEGSGLGPRGGEAFEPVARYESVLDPAALEVRQARQWLSYCSSEQLASLEQADATLAPRVMAVKHQRFATPLIHLLMLMLGMPFFLSREPANIITDSSKCLVLCGACFLLSFAGEHFVAATRYSALPAWLPLIVFTPVAAVLTDRIRT